jgi:uncharacterized protein (DUF58 family)
MLPREIVRQIRRLQFRARRAVEDLLGGEYHSVFKGTGIVFEEVREYQPGDDVRAIDWNVTARMGNAFVKRYIEERELTVMLVIDRSASQEFGTCRHQKREVAADLTAVLAVSGRVVVFLISDFLDTGYEHLLKRVGRQHDLILVRLTDPREEDLPSVGLVELEDAESGRRLLLHTGTRASGATFAASAGRRSEEFRRLARSARADFVEVCTDGRHLDALVEFFRERERRLRKQ